MPLKAAIPRYKASRVGAQTRTHQTVSNPACIIGLDVSTSLTDQDPRSANLLDNFFVRRHGNELRPGSSRHQSNIGSPVLSLMAYNPPRGVGSAFDAKLFAAAENLDIYDVTDEQNEAYVPTPDVTVPGQLSPGVFSWTNFATAGTNYLVICSAGAGVWTYDDVGGWVDRTAAITTIVAGQSLQFDFVMAWKNRLWFILNNSTEAFYLPTGSITGAATAFDFGPLLVHGGDLKAMASWTVDGGAGIDDKLIIMAEGGDVLIYEGTDPTAAATFRIVGRWFLGRPPSGRRFMSKYGGDLALITEFGVEYMSRVLQAHGEIDPETPRMDPARRFNETIGLDVRATRDENFWQLIWLPAEESAILLTPHNQPLSGYQYCFSALAQAWSRHVGMPMSCAETFDGNLYFGTLAGTILRAFEGNSDDELTDDTPGYPVIGDLQTAFVAANQDKVSLKRPVLVQVIVNASAAPMARAQVYTEWTRETLSGMFSFSPALVSPALFDVALWDESAFWGGGVQTYISWIGVTGLGAFCSLRLNLQGAPRTVFTGWKLVYEPGGIM